VGDIDISNGSFITLLPKLNLSNPPGRLIINSDFGIWPEDYLIDLQTGIAKPGSSSLFAKNNWDSSWGIRSPDGF